MLSHRTGLGLLMLLALCAPSPVVAAQAGPRPAPAELDAYLTEVRAALGQDQPGQVVQTSGVTTKHGMPASYRWIFEPGGFFRRDMRGTFPESVGFAGERIWRVDGRTPAYPLSLLEEDRWLTIAWVWSGLWALPDSPFTIEARQSPGPGLTRVHLRLERGLLGATLDLRDESHLPQLLKFDEGFGGGSLTFEDWREEGTASLPWKVTEVDLLGMTLEHRAQDARPWTGLAPTYVPVANPRQDAEFLPDAPAFVPVKRTASGHVFVKPKVNGKEVGWFLFDSGLGGSVITRSAADALELGAFGETRLMGFGTDEPQKVRLRQSHVVQVGPLLLDGLVLVESGAMTMADRLLGSETCAGALGWDVFLRSVVEFDPASAALKLHDPAEYENAAASWEAIVLHWQVPYLEASFEGGRRAYFGLDTGAGEVTALFHNQAVQRLGLLEDREVDGIEMQGASGSFRMTSAELEWFEVAGQRHAPARVLLSTAEDGEADPYTAGFLGGGFLEGQRVIFDYRGQRVGFVDVD